MTRISSFALTPPCLAIGLVPATAAAEQLCGTVAEFNQAMAESGTHSTDVPLTLDVDDLPTSSASGHSNMRVRPRSR